MNLKAWKKSFVILGMAIILVVLWQAGEIIRTGDTDDSGAADGQTGTQTNGEEQPDDIENGKGTFAEGAGLTIVATGDNFMHDSVIQSGLQSDGSYNYDYIFEGIQKYLDEADICVLNQASVIGGNSLGVAGYPDFNAPEEICTAVEKAGFDAVLMASNRVNSMGSDAIRNCIDIWQEKAPDIKVLGIRKEEDDTDITVISVNGIKVALLNYTYGLNTAMSPEDIYMVSFLGAVNETDGSVSENILSAKVIADIERAEEQADFVVVFPCWGSEYEYKAGDIQRDFAGEMVEAGADLIIGTHPHYLQSVEWIESENGNRGLCYYSLGNLISSQNYAGAMLGGLARVRLTVKDGSLIIDESSTGLIPVVTQYTYCGEGELADMVGIVPYSQYTEELAAAHGISGRGGVSFTKSELQYILDTYIDRKFILE